jgi:hypothetical protein
MLADCSILYLCCLLWPHYSPTTVSIFFRATLHLNWSRVTVSAEYGLSTLSWYESWYDAQPALQYEQDLS